MIDTNWFGVGLWFDLAALHFFFGWLLNDHIIIIIFDRIVQLVKINLFRLLLHRIDSHQIRLYSITNVSANLELEWHLYYEEKKWKCLPTYRQCVVSAVEMRWMRSNFAVLYISAIVFILLLVYTREKCRKLVKSNGQSLAAFGGGGRSQQDATMSNVLIQQLWAAGHHNSHFTCYERVHHGSAPEMSGVSVASSLHPGPSHGRTCERICASGEMRSCDATILGWKRVENQRGISRSSRSRMYSLSM